MENVFDNDSSISIKIGQKFNIPSKYILDKKLNGFNVIEENINNGESLEKINRKYRNISSNDLIMMYRKLRGDNLLNETLKIINSFNRTMKISEIDSIESLKIKYEIWEKNNKDIFSEEEKILETINKTHDFLNKINTYDLSKFEKTKSLLLGKIVDENNNILTTLDGIDIFNKTILSLKIPFLAYNSDKKDFYKIYQGISPNETINYTNAIYYEKNKNVLYFTLYLGESDEIDIKERYTNGEINFSSGDIKLKIKFIDNYTLDDIILILTKHFPFKIIKISEIDISGQFYLNGINYKEFSFIDLITFKVIAFKKYLFINEIENAFHDMKSVSYRFRTISQGIITNINEKTYIKIPYSLRFTITIENNKLVIGVTKAISNLTINSFRHIISRVMSIYHEYLKHNQFSWYENFIPTINEKIIPKTKDVKIKKKNSQSKIFVSGYARFCQKNMKPKIIPDNEVEDWEVRNFIINKNSVGYEVGKWKDKSYKHNNKDKKYTVMKFPFEINNKYNEEYWNIVCPNPPYYYPGLKKNKDLKNIKEFPQLPCCFKEDHLENISKLSKLFEDVSIKKTKYIVKSTKLLDPFRTGKLPILIENLLSNFINNPLKLGVVRSNNSFVHCILYSINDEEYLSLKTDSEKEDYVRKIKRSIIEKINISVLKQEFYDFSEKSIKNQVLRDDIIFDSSLYYRLLEEHFEINIFVFKHSNESIELEKGRSKYNSIKTYRERKIVLIYKNPGSTIERLKNIFQYELIISDNKKSFDEKINQNMFNIYIDLYPIISWNFEDSYNIKETYDFDYKNNYISIINTDPKYQYIDQYGKMRALIYKNNITMIFRSSQPENLPIIEKIPEGALLEDILYMFDNELPNSKVIDSNNTLLGLWYKIFDIENGLFFPITPTMSYGENIKKLPLGPNNPLNQDSSKIKRLRKIERDISIILHIVLWAYIHSDQKKFLEKYSIITNDKRDSSLIYDLKNIDRVFPKVESLTKVFSYLNKKVPTLVNGNKFQIYSKKLYDGIIYFLEKFREQNSGLEISVSEIKDLFSYEDDFMYQERVKIFLNENEINKWISISPRYIINNTMINLDKNRKNPYIFSNQEDEKIYIIQNVKLGDKNKALNVSLNWYLYGINLGFFSDSIDTEISPAHVIYGLTLTHILIIKKSYSNSSKFLSIFDYGDNYYASIINLSYK